MPAEAGAQVTGPHRRVRCLDSAFAGMAIPVSNAAPSGNPDANETPAGAFSAFAGTTGAPQKKSAARPGRAHSRLYPSGDNRRADGLCNTYLQVQAGSVFTKNLRQTMQPVSGS